MEIRYYQKFYHFISMPFFENFAPPLTQSQLRHFCLFLLYAKVKAIETKLQTTWF